MKRILIIGFCLLDVLVANSQSFGREDIIGVWTSREVSFAKNKGHAPVENTTVEKMKRGLINAQFIFRSNGLFFLKLPANAPTEFRELEAMNNKMWHIRSKEQMVFVGSLDEDLMMINVKQLNGRCYFFIQDSPLVLKMERNR
ncbi:MAG TPA: hypothetical protein VFZ52_16805 [Chryseolinea sp.]